MMGSTQDQTGKDTPAWIELHRGWLRYEKARRLNVTQWQELHKRKLAG